MTDHFSLDPDQIDYMKTVLGLDKILVPSELPAEALAPRSQAATFRSRGELETSRMIAIFPLEPGDFPLAGEAESLVDKMIRAMKVDPADVYTFEWSRHSAASELDAELARIRLHAGSRPVVVFGGSAAASDLSLPIVNGQWSFWESARVMPTFSPRELIESPDRKRVAWVHLQAVMKEL